MGRIVSWRKITYSGNKKTSILYGIVIKTYRGDVVYWRSTVNFIKLDVYTYNALQLIIIKKLKIITNLFVCQVCLDGKDMKLNFPRESMN